MEAHSVPATKDSKAEKMAALLKLNYKLNTITIKNTIRFFWI